MTDSELPAELASETAEPAAPRSPSLLDRFFRTMIKHGASDLHLRSNSTPHMRINMVVHPVKTQAVTAEQMEQVVQQMLSDKQRASFEETGSIDVAYEIPGSDRFRINLYRQRGQIALAARRVTKAILDFAGLHLPDVLSGICEYRQGLVLLAGQTGSGKSTTIASMLEYINQHRPCHVITLEDPIEFLFENKKALVSQREIGIDVPDFVTALKYLMREDPDVVLIGELRDQDTFSAALQAAETGHLVFGTIHASGAPQTVSRLLDLFGSDDREQARQALAFNLRAVVCQMLLPCAANGIERVPACEVLLGSPLVRQYIAEGRDNELPDLIRGSERDGMRTFATSLMELIEHDLVDPRTAYEYAPNADELKMRVKGISTGAGGLINRSFGGA